MHASSAIPVPIPTTPYTLGPYGGITTNNPTLFAYVPGNQYVTVGASGYYRVTFGGQLANLPTGSSGSAVWMQTQMLQVNGSGTNSLLFTQVMLQPNQVLASANLDPESIVYLNAGDRLFFQIALLVLYPSLANPASLDVQVNSFWVQMLFVSL